MNRFFRAAVVLLVVAVALFGLAAVAGTDAVRAGAAPVDLIPIVLGVGLKGVLALLAAAVMAWAGHLEGVRQRLQAAAQPAPAPTAGAVPVRLPSRGPEPAEPPVEEAA